MHLGPSIVDGLLKHHEVFMSQVAMQVKMPPQALVLQIVFLTWESPIQHLTQYRGYRYGIE